MKEELLRIESVTKRRGYACAGVILVDGWAVDAAPIYRWMIGMRDTDILSWPAITSYDTSDLNADGSQDDGGHQES